MVIQNEQMKTKQLGGNIMGKVKNIFIKFNEENEDFPKVISTIREHEITGVNNGGELIWGQFTSRNQAAISKQHKQQIENQLANGVPTKVFFYSRKAGLLYEAELLEIYDRDYIGATDSDFVKLIPQYYRHLAGVTHITAKTPMVIYTYFRIKGLKPISLENNVGFLHHYDRDEPILDVKGMQALLYVSIEEGYEYPANLVVQDQEDVKIESKNLILNSDVEIPNVPDRNSSKRKRYGSKRDYSAEAEAKGKMGKKVEELVLIYEKNRLFNLGLTQLAKKVEHKSVTEGDGLGYDILSYNEDGSERYVEVKGTVCVENVAFPISKNEIEFSQEQPDSFYIYRVYNFKSEFPQLKIYQGSVSEIFNLEATSFLARVK